MTAATAPVVVTLASYGLLRVRGGDAVSFLQGQLSGDVQRLQLEGSQLAGLHNPQGRAIAVLRLLRLADDDILALLPAELAQDVLARLRRYVLRAKLQIENASAAWCVAGSWGDAAAGAAATARLPDGRCIAVFAREHATPWPADGAPWELADIAMGLPQIYRATSEAFVGQMLNLDLVDAISFSKGCYTGQEVIARAHYRGRVKRRMQRFCSLQTLALAPGESYRIQDGRKLQVVRAAQLPDGRSEFLAVLSLLPTADAPEVDAAQAAVPALDVAALPLPYALPGD